VFTPPSKMPSINYVCLLAPMLTQPLVLLGAGIPQQHINEIHGAWFDPSNPVVPMEGSLRDDLCNWLMREEKLADLCLALGTSLCGMNADRMVTTPARKAARPGSSCLGSVIVSVQQTVHDSTCSLRIFAKLDNVMELLMTEMGLVATEVPKPCESPYFAVQLLRSLPYDPADGSQCGGDVTTTLDISPGARIKLTAGPGAGYEGQVIGRDAEGNLTVDFPCTREGHPDQGKVLWRYSLGWWMLQAAAEGRLRSLPFVNTEPQKSSS